MVSIVRQRQLIDSQRKWGIAMLVIGIVGMGVAALSLLDGTLPLGAVLFVILLVTGVTRIRAAGRALAAFETEHGAGAGVQQPIR
jgi:hypothetical protein